MFAVAAAVGDVATAARTAEGWTWGNPTAVEAIATVLAFIAAGVAIGIEMHNSRRLAQEIADRATAAEREHAALISLWPERNNVNPGPYNELHCRNASDHPVTEVRITDSQATPHPDQIIVGQPIFTEAVLKPNKEVPIWLGDQHQMAENGDAGRYVVAFTDRNGIRWKRRVSFPRSDGHRA